MLKEDISIKRKIAGSSAIHTITYSTKKKMLTIYFTSNEDKGYEYPNVPMSDVRDFLQSDSKGSFYHRRLKKYAQL